MRPAAGAAREDVGDQPGRSRLASAGALGDPAKAARLVLDVAAMADPPLRLILGSEAYAYAMAAGRARAESDAAWHDLTISTDRDDATAAQRDPLGPARS